MINEVSTSGVGQILPVVVSLAEEHPPSEVHPPTLRFSCAARRLFFLSPETWLCHSSAASIKGPMGGKYTA